MSANERDGSPLLPRDLAREGVPCAAAGRGRGAARRGGSEPGNLKSWKPAGLRGRFSVFQDFRFSPSQAPHLPAASPGARRL